MPRGASPKREREYEEIKGKIEKEGRYKGREEEVAARIVNKQRREAGETKGQQRGKSARGGSAKSRGNGGGGGSTRSGGGKSRSKSSRSNSSRSSSPRSSTRAKGRSSSGRSSGRSSASSSRRSSSSSRSSGGRGAGNRVLTDHDEIRRWAEERDAQPACVRGTGGGGDTAMIRLDFPGFSGAQSLQPIEWDEWLRQFDENDLALIVQDRTSGGQTSNFNKLISRSTAQRSGGGGSSRGGNSRSGKSRGGSRKGSRSKARASAR